MTTKRPRTESSIDSKYRTTIHNLTVARAANDVGDRDESDIGSIERVDVETTRSRKRDSGTYHRTVSYVVEDGIAYVAEIAPRNPESTNADHAFKPGHVAAIVTETDAVVRESVPEVEGVRALSDTLGTERSKAEGEQQSTDTAAGQVEA